MTSDIENTNKMIKVSVLLSVLHKYHNTLRFSGYMYSTGVIMDTRATAHLQQQRH